VGRSWRIVLNCAPISSTWVSQGKKRSRSKTKSAFLEQKLYRPKEKLFLGQKLDELQAKRLGVRKTSLSSTLPTTYRPGSTTSQSHMPKHSTTPTFRQYPLNFHCFATLFPIHALFAMMIAFSEAYVVLTSLGAQLLTLSLIPVFIVHHRFSTVADIIMKSEARSSRDVVMPS
jgi:hypothetical protein